MESGFFVRACTNNNLTSLTTSGYVLSPAFNNGVTAYAITVPEGKTSVTFRAKVSNSTALVYINGKKATSKSISMQNAQTVTVAVLVKAQAGNTRAFTVTMTRPPHITSFTASPKVKGKYTVQPDGKPLKFSYKLAGKGGTALLQIDLGGGNYQTITSGACTSGGSKSYTWDGKLSGVNVAPGTYAVRLGVTYSGLTVSKNMSVVVK